jgi:type IX secretion system PorP/SprF family membrane protein
MRFIIIFITIPIFLLALDSRAQQRPHYAQYQQNYFLLNPALAGLESYADARIGYRRQWVGLEGSPQTFYMTTHVPIGNPDFKIQPASVRFSHQPSQLYADMPDPHAGVGLSVIADQSGSFSRLTANASAAFHYPISDEWQVSIGLSGGATQHSINFDHIRLANPQDPVLLAGRVNLWRPDLNVGLWVYSPNFYAGFSAQQLLGDKLSLGQNKDKSVSYYFATLGGRLDISDDWQLIPSILLKKATESPLSSDWNLKVSYLNNLEFGLSYRHTDALLGWVSSRINQKFVVSYGYEFVMSNLQTVSSGSHEITIGITLGNKRHYSSPRLFW